MLFRDRNRFAILAGARQFLRFLFKRSQPPGVEFARISRPGGRQQREKYHQGRAARSNFQSHGRGSRSRIEIGQALSTLFLFAREFYPVASYLTWSVAKTSRSGGLKPPALLVGD